MRGIVVIAALLAAMPAAAQQHQHGNQQQGQHADHAGHTAALPQGWEQRLDRPNSTAPVHLMSMDGHLHAILGPAGIFYNPQTTATGNFTAQGTFTLNKPSEHPEAFGLMVGGRDLQGPAQDYLYFLVRQDGRFMVKHRAGTETHTVIDWTEHAAVQRPGADGKATNTLAVESHAQGVRFLVNGQEVGALPRGVNTSGVVGLRLNHNLDVTITDFGVHPAGHSGH
jgi:hypothetical protein